MKAKEIRALSKEEREKKITELQKEQMKERAHMSAGTPPKNVGLFKQRKKIIARINTINNE